MTALGLDRATAEAAIAVAVRAPSIHNTQPWSWRLDGDGLVLVADRTRQLAVADPDGHSLLVSCGAALHLTELALRGAGVAVETALLPDPAQPDELAVFRPVGRTEVDEQTLREIEAALKRRSDRRPFAAHEVAPETVDELHAASSAPQARVDFPTREDERIDLAVAVSWADRVERDDQAYLEEQKQWLRDPDVHALVDGVPADAIPHVPAEAPRHTDVPLRDFEVGLTGRQLIARDVDERPLIAVVLTDFDNAMDHLTAGQAMMRLMIAAQLRGLATCPLSQAVDFAEFRTRVQRVMGWVGYPQIMLRVGYPGGPASDLVRTPRREVGAVLRVVE
ncbi:MAG TPA: nitroreductase family protein [Jatrophihabitans sp.]|jgi:nitroreductase|nr:nitroreductase family protein [Jatrophihabitans sp.]